RALLTRILVPAQGSGHRGAYGKLRTRDSIDFPLLGLAARLAVDANGVVEDADLVGVALVARPSRVRGVADALRGSTVGSEAFEAAVEAAAQLAYKQLRPMDNIPGDAWYRRELVPVVARRTLLAAAAGEGPVHPV
ncbi:MAG: hypothetical protein ISQ08_11970, partial [Planctomycetes bacterium]|nr:hypothetical protein [Planctomycetota bacterium]